MIEILPKYCFLLAAKKEILHKVSGTFPSGNLIAIMGPSGAGTYPIVYLNLQRQVLISVILQASRRSSMLSRDTSRKELVAQFTSMEESEIWVSKHRNFPCRLAATCHSRFVTQTCKTNPFISRIIFIFADEFKKTTTYITQDDRLQLLLTVFENMKIAADLKLGDAVSSIEKNIRVS